MLVWYWQLAADKVEDCSVGVTAENSGDIEAQWECGVLGVHGLSRNQTVFGQDQHTWNFLADRSLQRLVCGGGSDPSTCDMVPCQCSYSNHFGD